MFILVDPPTLLSSVEEWKRFIVELESKPKTEEVQSALKEARQFVSNNTETDNL